MGDDLTLMRPGVGPDPLSLLSPAAQAPGVSELGKAGPVMPVYVGIDVHRKRSQVAVIDTDGEVLANRNVPYGVEKILA